MNSRQSGTTRNGRNRTGALRSVFLALVMLAAAVFHAGTRTAFAETVYATGGDGDKTVIFYVETYGQAELEFTQTEGLCAEVSLTHAWDGIRGREEEWGKYHFDVSPANGPGRTTRVNWDKTFNGGEFSIRFSSAGVYRIQVTPYTAQEMTDSWTLDRFLYWNQQPFWWISGHRNCRSYVAEPTTPAPVPADRSGTVTVRCYGESGLMNSYQVTIEQSQMVYPQDISGYSCSMDGVWVSLDKSTGECSPGVVEFYYYQNQPEDYTGGYTPGGDGPSTEYATMPMLPQYGVEAYLDYSWQSQPYIKPQCGPGDSYQVFRSMNGSQHLYNPGEMTQADIYFTTGGWDYVRFGYSDGKWRYGFFRSGVFQPYSGWSGIPEYSLSYEEYGTVIQDTIPHNGPDWNSGSYESCKLYTGNAVYACMESNGWYLCRFWNDHDNYYGDVYLWVPGDAISFW